MDHARCNMFPNVWPKACTHTVYALRVIEGIQEGRWKEPIERLRSIDPKDKDTVKKVKFRLPCVTFSGVFSPERFDDKLIEYSNMVVLDVDDISKKDLVRFKRELMNDEHVACFFDGPTKGVKILFHVSTEAKEHKLAFFALSNYIKDNYDIIIDRSGKNVSRLCFVSYDPDLYYNPSYKIFEIKHDDSQREMFSRVFSPAKLPSSVVMSFDMSHIFDTCIKIVKASSVGSYHQGNRNNYIFALACTLNRAGMDEEHALAMIWNKYSSLDYKELQGSVGSAYRHNKSEFGSKPITERRSNQGDFFRVR